jgi:hypothetical protein
MTCLSWGWTPETAEGRGQGCTASPTGANDWRSWESIRDIVKEVTDHGWQKAGTQVSSLQG